MTSTWGQVRRRAARVGKRFNVTPPRAAGLPMRLSLLKKELECSYDAYDVDMFLRVSPMHFHQPEVRLTNP